MFDHKHLTDNKKKIILSIRSIFRSINQVFIHMPILNYEITKVESIDPRSIAAALNRYGSKRETVQFAWIITYNREHTLGENALLVQVLSEEDFCSYVSYQVVWQGQNYYRNIDTYLDKVVAASNGSIEYDLTTRRTYNGHQDGKNNTAIKDVK